MQPIVAIIDAVNPIVRAIQTASKITEPIAVTAVVIILSTKKSEVVQLFKGINLK